MFLRSFNGTCFAVTDAVVKQVTYCLIVKGKFVNLSNRKSYATRSWGVRTYEATPARQALSSSIRFRRGANDPTPKKFNVTQPPEISGGQDSLRFIAQAKKWLNNL
jgi:hypothetical protein